MEDEKPAPPDDLQRWLRPVTCDHEFEVIAISESGLVKQCGKCQSIAAE